MGLDDAENVRQDFEQRRLHDFTPGKDYEDAEDETDNDHRPAQSGEVEEGVGPVVDVVPPRPRKVPGSDLETDNDAGKGDGVVKAGAVVRRLGVDAHEDKNGYGEEYGSEIVAGVQPILERRAVVELDVGDGGAHDGTDDDVEEAVHAAVEAAEDDGEGVEVGKQLERERCAG